MTNPIPNGALGNHIAFLGGTGSGKTSAAKTSVVEPELADGKRALIIDPTGAWWGLRSSATGKSKGFPVYIFGGDHGDYPLRASDGAPLAEAFANASDSAVFDTSLMTVSDRTRFFTEYATTLLRKNRGPVMQIIDEAHLFMPQQGAQAHGGVPQMLHAANNLVSLGRSRGLRITIISQRPAKIHKDSLSQVQTMVAMRMVGPQDRKAISDWIADQADPTQGKEIIASLPSLKPGEAWVWAPIQNFLHRVKFDMPRTFDSSRAPELADGEGPKLSPIDLDVLAKRLGKVADDKKANDPATLRAEITRLNAELKKGPPQNITDPKAIDVAEQRGYDLGYKAAIGSVSAKFQEKLGHIRRSTEQNLDEAWEYIASVRQSAEKTTTNMPKPVSRAQPMNGPNGRHHEPVKTTPSTAAGGTFTGSIGKGERIILTAIAQYPDGVTREQLTVLTGYKRSTRDAYIQRLAASECIYLGTRITATSIGFAALGIDYEPLPTGAALREKVLRELPEGESKILQVVLNTHPTPADRDNISNETGYKRSTRDAYIQRLSARELIHIGGGGISPSPNLFD